jgi:hypothetical protein
MLIAGVVCLCVAAAFAMLGVRALARPAVAGGPQQVLRSVAPTQLAAAMMLGAGGAVALSTHPSLGLMVLCIAGALGTVGAGLWQGARFAHASVQRQSALHASGSSCQGSGAPGCASCTRSCQ